MVVAIKERLTQNIAAIAAMEDNRRCTAVDALLIIALALDILGTPRAVRGAAKRIKPDADPAALYIIKLILKANDPIAMVKQCLANLE